MTNGDSYFLFHVLPVFFIKYCLTFCIQKTNGGSVKACQLSSVWKIFEEEFIHSLSTLILHLIKLENFVMQLRRSPYRPGRMKALFKRE